ncbi:MAG TPA: cell division ATP-binding protein FtsE [Gammaproteobacteria bacterium]|jgi:cell division transport system ATP-binding protein|nr:cell division ATP-binding protein FtsE [Gammaproteobacteria bacterium]
MIECRYLGKRYADGQSALSDINLNIERGELAFLTGHSGAGKSTLLRLIALIERPTRGSLKVNGHDLAKLPDLSIPRYRRNIGMIFQDHRLLPDRNVFENVALPLRITGADSKLVARRTRAALDKVGLLKKEKSTPTALSAGEQQRVGIARAIVNRPTILLADEPTGNLDPKLSAEIMQLFLDFNRVGVTVLVASHDQSLVHRFGERVIELKQGSLMA